MVEPSRRATVVKPRIIKKTALFPIDIAIMRARIID